MGVPLQKSCRLWASVPLAGNKKGTLDPLLPDIWIPGPGAWAPNRAVICITGASGGSALMAKIGAFLGYTVHKQVESRQKESKEKK